MGCCTEAKYKNMAANTNYIRSKEVPQDLKLVIVENVELATANLLNPPRKSILKMFEVYNKYVNDYPDDDRCSSCVSAVYKFWKGTVVQWRKDGLI